MFSMGTYMMYNDFKQIQDEEDDLLGRKNKTVNIMNPFVIVKTEIS